MDTHTMVISVSAVLVVEGIIFMRLFAPINAAFKRIKKISEWTEAVLSVYATLFTLSIITLIITVLIPACIQASSGRPASTQPLTMATILDLCTVFGCSFCQMCLFLLLGKLVGEIEADKNTKEVFPSKPTCTNVKKTQPIVPIDLPFGLNTEHKPPFHISTDYAGTTPRKTPPLQQITPANPKPSNSKGLRYEDK
jgi:hypothetical protein